MFPFVNRNIVISSANTFRNDAKKILTSSCRTQVRGMATEKQILMRITATSNIAKITKSMKMVSAAKMRAAQNRLVAGRPFVSWLDRVGIEKPTLSSDGTAKGVEGNNSAEADGTLIQVDLNDISKQNTGNTNRFIVISSDRGLCGGCNTYVCKAVKVQMSKLPSESTSSIFLVGEKGRAQLSRLYSDYFTGSVSDCWKEAPPSFAMASAMATGAMAAGPVDKMHVVYNRFVSAITYHPSIRTVNMGANTKYDDNSSNAPVDPFLEYEFEPDNRSEFMEDLSEFQLATAIFHGMVEGGTSEESSRMAAMENATNNAQELIQDLTLTYNKARQSRITTELIEIISGASSLEDSS